MPCPFHLHDGSSSWQWNAFAAATLDTHDGSDDGEIPIKPQLEEQAFTEHRNEVEAICEAKAMRKAFEEESTVWGTTSAQAEETP